jgi:hypothetical protein
MVRKLASLRAEKKSLQGLLIAKGNHLCLLELTRNLFDIPFLLSIYRFRNFFYSRQPPDVWGSVEGFLGDS